MEVFRVSSPTLKPNPASVYVIVNIPALARTLIKDSLVVAAEIKCEAKALMLQKAMAEKRAF